jgi:hypothetical protein
MLAAMARTAPLLLLFWVLVAALLYLWPFRLNLAPVFHTNDAAWSSQGVTFAQNGMLRTAAPPRALHERLAAGTGLTVAAWVTSASANQAGPARIVTYSEGAAARNFTLGQERSDLVFRLRASPADPNGVANEITVPDVFTPRTLRHVAVTWDLRALAVYVDGAPRAQFDGHAGSPAAWDPAHHLAVGNELTGDRPWRGTVAAVAIDARAKSAAELRADYRRGPSAPPDATAAYDFTRGPAAVRATPAPLTRPPAYLHGIYPELLTREPRRAEDFVFSFGVFAVLGWLAAAWAATGRGLSTRTALLVVPPVLAAAVALESLQFYVEGRTSSLRDLVAATAGGLTGVLLCGALHPSPQTRV